MLLYLITYFDNQQANPSDQVGRNNQQHVHVTKSLPVTKELLIKSSG